MRRTLMFVAAAVFSLPVLAMHCPKDMAEIDAMLESNPPADTEVRERVAELRAEGEELHNAGKHEEAVEVLGEALELLESTG
ncbi:MULTISPECIES: hypothetical protein [Pseudomonas]|uniref:hypothetical protein n=1 Tax=Pseudomonas TaxID=286 RepID=UPI00123929BB|nr:MULTISPECIES: hypothetical protein [Pseudomonas]QIB49594.1 hypothetical protein G3M63_00030 [Pseudomonas sp. OIL-1]